MATTLTQAHPLLAIPFSSDTDFTVLADHSEHFANALIENDDPALKQALGSQLVACLALLHTTLNDPVPPHLVESLTVDTFPATDPCFEPDTELLCDYCLALGKLLTERALSPESETVLNGLLVELVWYFSAELKAPRWARIKRERETYR